jgi:phosphoribosylglycinamide formyltransferase 1
MNQLNIAYFLSNNSRTTKLSIDYLLKYKKNINISLLVFDKKNSGIYENLSNYNIPRKIFSKWKNNRENICNEICDECTKYKIDYIFCSFEKVLTGKIMKIYENKIVNIHPSILPLFKGYQPQKKSFDSNIRFMGCTVHFIEESIDEGVIICQGIIHKNNNSYENHTKRLFYVMCLSFISGIIFVLENRLKINGKKCQYIDATYKNNYINPAPKEIDTIIKNMKTLHDFD